MHFPVDWKSHLEVAIDSADHQQLLELLRTLGEAVELARVSVTGDRKLLCASRRSTE